MKHGGSTKRSAVAFDLDLKALAKHRKGLSRSSAYGDIRRVMEAEGFTWVQGSLYYGPPEKDLVENAVRRLALLHAWFGHSVRDIRFMLVDDEDDLLPCIPACDRRRTFSEWWATKRGRD